MSSGLMSGEKVRTAFTAEHRVGARVGGKICEPFPFERQRIDFDTDEPMTWDDGNPCMQIVVTVQTDLNDGPDEDGVADDGRRRFYLNKPSDLHKKTQTAVRRAGGKDFELGADYFATRTGQDAPRKKGKQGAWLHEVEYSRPRAGSGLNSGNTVLDRSQNRQAAAKAQPVDDSEPPF